MNHIIAKLKDEFYIGGLIVIIVSLAVFCIPFFIDLPADRTMGLFIVNFACTLGYFLVLKAYGRLKKGREGLIPLFLLLILFLISAFSLNRDMGIFDGSVTWLSVVLVILCINYILFQLFDVFPRWLQHTMTALLGVAAIVFLYFSLYLAPLYVVSTVIVWVLGISAHSFVPLLFLLFTIKLIRRTARNDKKLWYSFAGGATAILIFALVFIIQWGQVTQTINTTYRKAGVAESNGLPAWIAAAQHASQGWVAERVLKSDLVYSTPSITNNWDGLFWGASFRNFDEPKKHDPLVMTAAFFAGKPNLPNDDRIKILESVYDSRHQAQERLWSGDDLYTEHITTDVRVWPQFGLAYTEKNITVTNAGLQERWRGNQQEAIYTFHLPEGAVITALSLWIEGKEEKGILTSKAKADSAYKTIVGKEMRDPSVVHWQEGNTVSVRVFPVIAGQSRRFKLGITAPLIRRDNKLVYENIWFDGPASHNAQEEATLNFQQSPRELVVPAVFGDNGQQTWKRAGKYEPDWKVQLSGSPLATDAFSFDGQTYTVHPYHPQRLAFDAGTVYLDINRAWSRSEFEMIYDLVKHKTVFVYDNGLVKVTSENRARLFDQLQSTQFSMFPLFEIEDPATALLITKNPVASPNLGDLTDSRYLQQLKTYLAGNGSIRLFNIGDHLSPYLKSLKEYRVFQYEHGELALLKELLEKKIFAHPVENDKQVVIDDAGIMLLQQVGTSPSNAPDHLMRLFAYNHIMQKSGNGLLIDKPVEDGLVQEAVKAYVVSPVSSLVVLETQKDYDRFNITDSKNSLKNASLQSKGAVPEPHEWALIIIAVLVILTIKFKPVLNKNRI